MKTGQKESGSEARGHYSSSGVTRRAVGYIRVSTDMQAAEGLSLEAQQAAIESYCVAQGIRLVRICKDVLSGARDQRPGLQEALAPIASRRCGRR